ncbi:MAG: transcriptional repressor LexA [Proteobacteria bacterium]|nr:transcriptional repressor LexA [Pseudomonadota bacterium]
MTTLTERQAEILEMIRDAIEETGMPPTRAEIAQSLGFRSANAAEEHLRALARKNVIELVPGASRGIRLVEEDPGLPVVGKVAAGHPILAEQNIERHYRMDPSMFRPKAHYLLTVQGMSMRDAGILDGDLLAIHRTPEVRNGQIIVARLNDDEVTVKRYRQRGREVWLLPENPEFEPIHIDLAVQRMVIEGVVVGVIRNGRLQ